MLFPVCLTPPLHKHLHKELFQLLDKSPCDTARETPEREDTTATQLWELKQSHRANKLIAIYPHASRKPHSVLAQNSFNVKT